MVMTLKTNNLIAATDYMVMTLKTNTMLYYYINHNFVR